ncbi:MAG: DUF1289 domain-containing protein [Marinobacter sp.]|uniref:DUF1289 domain-containing protein n=1 Tax=Gammaproteobacteria TaxID=1236 RepID=UPI003F9A8FB8
MAKPIKNPCNSVCQLTGDVCRGCERTRTEIKTWKKMKRPERQTAVKEDSVRLISQSLVGLGTSP